MFLFDRLYGRLVFPPIIQSILDCPGLLRLREVGMANVPFFSFPSFNAVTRYEHSIGVCHLANIVAKNIGLSEKDRIELMLAALYHDVATPPFAHAMEEVLNELFGFNHESKLRELFLGKQVASAGMKSQMFLGRSLKIHRLCESREGRRLKLDALRISDIATGENSEPIGDLICSDGIDLDNIDNVVRAATAMGMKDVDLDLPEILASSFVSGKGGYYLDEGSSFSCNTWQEVRSNLYGMIFASINDFSLQTMLKKAVKLLPTDLLDEGDWALTDSQLVYEKLLHHQPSADIVERMRLGKTFECLACFLVEGENIVKNRDRISSKIEGAAEEIYIDFIESVFKKKKNFDSILPNISVNYYIDKRRRDINRSFVFFDRITESERKTSLSQSIIFGVFTSNHRGWDKLSVDKLIERILEFDSSMTVSKIKIDLSGYPSIIKEVEHENDLIN